MINDGVNAAASQSFGYDAADRLTVAGNSAYDRDAAGNRLSDGRLRYAYGTDNRLASVSRIRRHGREKRLASYVYNGKGERVMKRLGREDEQATWYVYDLSGHLVAELAAHHRSARVTAEYVYGPTGRLATIAVRGDDGRGREERGHRRHERDDASESVYWHINDHLGTPQALTDRRGRVIWAANYLPFGNIVRPRNGDDDGRGREHREYREGRHWKITNNFRFPGQYYDAETGLNYNYYRNYDPTLGRYIENDPIGLNGGMNSFGYVAGNPVNLIDPNGQDPLIVIGAIIGGVSGAIQAANAGGGWTSENASNIFLGLTTGAGIGALAGLTPTQWGPLATLVTGALAGGGGNLVGQATSWAVDRYNNPRSCTSFNPDLQAVGIQALLGGSSALLGFSSGLGYALNLVRGGSSSAAAIEAGGLLNVITAGSAQVAGNNLITVNNGGFLPQ